MVKLKHVFIFCTLLIFYCHPAESQIEKDSASTNLKKADQGDIIYAPELKASITQLGYRQTILPGPQFLISDNPEYIKVPEAIAMQEKINPGSVRLYMYNVNGVSDPIKMDRRILPLLTNNSQNVMHMRMLHYASEKPSDNYYLIGKTGLQDYFNSKPQQETIQIAPGQTICIDPRMVKSKVGFNELAHGFYEFVVDQPGTISILQTDTKKPITTIALNKTREIPGDNYAGSGRGIFGVSNYLIQTDTVETAEGITQLVIADGKKDTWIKGFDQTTQSQIELSGNYGVIYEINIPWKSTNGKAIALLTSNVRNDGEWCQGMANAIVVSQGKFKAGVVLVPSKELTVKSPPQAALIQIFYPEKENKVQTIKLRYSPPGASCLPTPLFLVPID